VTPLTGAASVARKRSSNWTKAARSASGMGCPAAHLQAEPGTDYPAITSGFIFKKFAIVNSI